MKNLSSKIIGKDLLNFNEIEKILLGAECKMNYWPIYNQKENIDDKVLSPSIVIKRIPETLFEEDLDEDFDVLVGSSGK